MALSGAEYLAQIYGTDKDRVNCSFYFKIGACRHGDQCSRLHNKPRYSQTLLLKNLYANQRNSLRCSEEMRAQQVFDVFFGEVFVELEDLYGKVDEVNVCDNDAEHMVGNVYVKFRREKDAMRAEVCLNNRWFDGQPIYAELSPVTDFREACCRQYEMGECTRGAFCNFMHLKPISSFLRRKLYTRRIDRKRYKKVALRKTKARQKRIAHVDEQKNGIINCKLPRAYQIMNKSDSSEGSSSASDIEKELLS